jgi:hypothetical protein
MKLTNIKSSPSRIAKNLEISTYTGRYQLNTPGPGASMPFMEDPHFRLQKWGANYESDMVNLENKLTGRSQSLNRDVNTYANLPEKNKSYSSSSASTEQSRTIMPAWTLLGQEHHRYDYPHLDPQENVFYPFENNTSTRILEKDNYVRNTYH